LEPQQQVFKASSCRSSPFACCGQSVRPRYVRRWERVWTVIVSPDILWKSLAVLNAAALGANNSVQHSFYLCYPLDLDPMSMMAGHYTVPYGRQKCCIDGLGDCVCGRPASKSPKPTSRSPNLPTSKIRPPTTAANRHPQTSFPLQKSNPPTSHQKTKRTAALMSLI
jgi:hypothetical protein